MCCKRMISKCWLLWLLCLYAQAESLLPLSRYGQPPALSPEWSPKLWLAMDTQADRVTADTQPLRTLIDALAREVISPWPAQRTLPAEGVALGLLAVTQSTVGVLHPAQPLDALMTWPGQDVSRQLRLIRNTQGHVGDDQLWHVGQQQSLALRWPMPDAPIDITELHLDLPVRINPSHWPVLQLQFADGFTYDLPSPQMLAEDSGMTARLSLHSAITSWQQAGHDGQIPPWPWQVRLQAQAVDQQGAWALWQVSLPARVSIHWHDDSAQRTGREQWLRQLHSLLAGEGVQLPADAAALQQLMQQMQASSTECAKHAALLVAPAQPGIAADLSRWRDRQLAARPIVAHQNIRAIRTSLLGLDRDWHQPVAGRRAWPGGSEFYPCSTTSACELAPAPAMTNSSIPLSSWLTDSVSGQLLEPLNEHWSAFVQHDSYWQGRAEPPQAPILRGRSHYFDAGVSASAITGRQGYLLQVSSDGSVQLQDGNDGHWLWAWRPAQSASLWAELMQDDALEISTSDTQYVVSENDWVYWPDRDAASPETGLDATGQRWLYGLVDKQLVALDITQPQLPRSGFLPTAGNAHPAQAKAWGSLSLLPLTLSSGQSQPLLLLSAADPAASTKLLLLDGRSGSVLWRAGMTSNSQHDYADSALARGWQAAWRTLAATDGALLAYGIDELGAVWRLRIAPKPIHSSDIQVSLNRIADFSETGTLFPYSPSLTWLRDDQNQRYPALAFASAATVASGSVRAASVLAFLDRKLAFITAKDLPLWSAGAQPPAHAAGWRRVLPATELIAQPPRWLDQQLILAGEAPQTSSTSCPDWAWQARIYRWPWRAGRTQGAAETSLPVNSNSVGDPRLSEEGRLRWSGISAIDSQTTEVEVPMGYRQRVHQRQLRMGD